MVRLPTVDTNIFLRHLTQDHPEFSPRATAYLTRIEQGEFDADTNLLVVFETVFTLERSYKRSKLAIRDTLPPLPLLPGIRLTNKRRLRRVFDLYVRYNLALTDAYQAALVLEGRNSAVISFDRDYDRVPGVPRVEP